MSVNLVTPRPSRQTGQRQQAQLDGHEPDEIRPSAPDREPRRELARAITAARQQQVAEVAGAHHHDQESGGEGAECERLEPAAEVLREIVYGHGQARSASQAGAERRFGLVARDPILEARDDGERPRPKRGALAAVDIRQRADPDDVQRIDTRPHACPRKEESRWQDRLDVDGAAVLSRKRSPDGFGPADEPRVGIGGEHEMRSGTGRRDSRRPVGAA